MAKAEGLSHLTYAVISLFVNKQICNTTDKLLFDFLEKQDSLCGEICCNGDNGGLNFLDFT